MTLRKPTNTTWESWIDHQINAATRNGEFKNLAGEGLPLKLNKNYDADWWVKEKMINEKLDMTPPTLRVRQKTEKWLKNYLYLYNEMELRKQATKLNKEIKKANNADLGPLLPQQPLKIEVLITKWRQKNLTV